ncbi:MAG: hypothetical protein EOO01_06445 [Chitinophagaceae bacterium]|nr:MAG: hypothetical protein EOO01_06445 [Chitinophagaceae bacterium]
MEKHVKKLSKNRIVYLHNDEIADPIKVVHDFFSASWLPDHLKMLKQWRNDAAFESDGSNSRSPSFTLYGHELTIKLVEAAWLLKAEKLGRIDIDDEEEINIAKWHIKTEGEKLRDYPEHLNVREILKPSSVIKETFRIHKLDGYRKILNIWLYDALSTSFMEESLSKAEVIIVYEQLVKLFEAMWLIAERTKDRG